MLPYALSLFMLVATVFADCTTHSFTHCADGIVHWYDPNTGEVCDPLDCGGGRAPPKTNVPGCPLYTGTAVRTTSYLSCWTPPHAVSATIASVSATSTIVLTSATSTTASVSASSATLTGTVSVSPTGSSTDSSTGATAILVTSSEGSTSLPATTPAPSIPSPVGNNETSTSGAAIPTKTTGSNAGNILDGSLMAVAGAAFGAIVLI
ncbi:hypothetical protein TMatcc_004699 [Talaromyces marneffei ATCC 18224]|uniref:uncharacterized protein n=1 Tax=Talaromyces marneffei TaxID=37727 RepID=UPI0012A92499|nr:uncharacterized protein EYB26_000373 [Talaromyces marneffei]KAE8557254.1 hypothetical protein EYB25_001960 [Talaromyces marneffei]QGA12728.1 hypothetical protein EYB26_000373 [Talaromyces marneffei]